ncbi:MULTISPECIES: cytochrome ubiquinol oxidase subunit I [unclassified Imperialibacter]|uniref:cytochrome ubiquinol oxidase subunit I n=1 Tax=unclassified Imperialibacter TaxID=2629706 RepID=UPI001257652E|nr:MULTISPECIES: cytochrome ubiquinol oxidase subunit I [unclassified Imperialibacter]CAD5270540.1 Cytochrome ubiquinol oxidase subunit I [Imperialibacter sp. 75]CAD5298894.1 Cytochrome ubiquinol oxidase subunit I [Imperialibacter sp. 89]VVT35718.1 Cytochrome bd-I ubiquinol oxidase subunit 1 apoprotein [Imperialibacter sp. EC-SDR9]
MTDLLAARSQMAVSLGFHIIFSCIGMVMPFLMAFANYKWLKTGQEDYHRLMKAWARGVAIFFAVGAVSGTVLSFELGLLWPGFMEHAGPIIGMPFSLEGAAFFLEAVALGLFLYGEKVLKPWVHFTSGVFVGISGVASGILVVAANGWMNSPSGFDWVNGQALNVDPIAAMLNEAWFTQALHMTLAAFVATGFGVAGVHAWQYLKERSKLLHLRALKIALAFGAVAAFLQPFSGHLSADDVAHRQPVKLAAMESHFETEKGASFVIGGIPDEEKGEVNYAIKIPYLLSILAFTDPMAEVKGLDAFPRDEWPPVAIVHFAFQTMIAIGVLLMLIGVIFLFGQWKKPLLVRSSWFLKLLAFATPLGFLAVEAGWVVTEVGRQPWIIYGIMKTTDAVTPMPGIAYSFYVTTCIYLVLAILVFWLMGRQITVFNEEREVAHV